MKYPLLFLALITVLSTATAQIKVNPHIGINAIANEAVVDGTTIEGKVGFTAGVFVRIGTDNRLFLLPGFQYSALSMAGFRDEPGTVIELGNAQAEYIKIPLNIGLNLTGDDGILKIYLQAGLTPSFTVNKEALFEGIQNEIENQSFVLGGNIGIGVDVLFGTFLLNYEGGFTEVIKAANTTTNIWTIGFGVRL